MLSENLAERLVHLDFRLLIVIDDAAPCLRAASEGLESRVPILEILQLLAEGIAEKRERARIALFSLFLNGCNFSCFTGV